MFVADIHFLLSIEVLISDERNACLCIKYTVEFIYLNLKPLPFGLMNM